MADSGAVSRTIVLRVLQAHGVEISCQADAPDIVVLAKDGKVEAKRLSDEVGRKTLHYFQRKFGVPIHHFYHPLMAPGSQEEKIQ